MRVFSLRRLAILPLLAVAITAHAQKKALTQADWDRWRTIQGATLSNDGKWVAYTLSPLVGDGEFVVRSTGGSTEYRVPVGYISRPNNTPGGERPRGGGGGFPAGGGGGRGGRGGFGAGGPPSPFTADGRFAFVTAQPSKDEVERQERAAAANRGARGGARGGGAAPVNQTTVVMVSLADGKVTPLPGFRAFRLPVASGHWVAFTVADSTTPNDSSSGGRGGRGGRGGASPAGRRTFGTAVVLHNLDTGADERIADVLAFQFDDSAKVFAYTVASRDSTNDGVYIRNLAAGTTQAIMKGPGNYRGFTFDRAQQQFAFTSDHDDFGRPQARNVVYYGTLKAGAAQPLVRSDALPQDMHIPDNANLAFTRAGNALTLAIAPQPDDTIPADSLVGKARFDLWHWKDPQLMPTQLLQVNAARNPTYQAIFNLATKKLVQLTADSFPSIQLSDDARAGVASTSVPYNIERMWGDGGTDIYFVDPATGSRKLVAKEISANAQLSVGGKYIAYFDKGHWYTYATATGKITDISAAAKGVRFDDETDNHPDVPAPWGIAGWTRDDRSVIINDRFDLWDFDPTGGRAPIVLTDSLGRRDSTVFRLLALDRDAEDRAIDPTKTAWLSAFNEKTKASGFYRTHLEARRTPERVVMADVRFGAPQKAKNADEYLLTRSTFIEFPNLWVGPNFTSLTKVSDANPWQSEYNWGTVELVTWNSMDGEPLQGLLYKPENFDPKKKYPMITYFYEELSDGLHGYIAPNGRNTINPTHYVSNGYLVFEPDIHYEIGHPGQSAVKSIVPGVQKIIDRGYVDGKALGLQGHSWGGYQTLYLITQTQMFSAAMAGAPVVDMFSAYGGIRWGTGVNRSMQYEHGQSRIGQSIFEAPQLYIENSPLFSLPRVTTPLFILADDMDDAVPWYQGIELFVGMRRLQKEAYLINYNNELHSPQGRANQKDIAMRMQQFFDTKLKGAPAPDWIVKGIPAKDKGKDQVKKAVQP